MDSSSPHATVSEIHIKVKKEFATTPPSFTEEIMPLSEKLDAIFIDGYDQDDIFGMIIPLLMDGKVRLIFKGQSSERLELLSKWLHLPRSAAIAIFNEYISKRIEKNPQLQTKQNQETTVIELHGSNEKPI